MEHDQRICPRCGEPAAGYGFCQSCRSEIDALTGLAPREEARPSDHVLREVARLEQALAAASDGISDRIAGASGAAAVQVDPDERVSIGPPPPRDVARLEDVLRVAPRSDDPNAQTSVAPPTNDDDQLAPEAAQAALEVEPAAEVEAETPAAVATPEPVTETGPATPAQAPAGAPSYVAAHRLRAAFWFEQTSAFEQALAFDADVDSEVTAHEEPQQVAEVLAQAGPPSADAERDTRPEPLADAQACAEPNGTRNHWLFALCLLALIAVVVALTGRNPRR